MHLCIDVKIISDMKDIPKIIFTRTQAHKDIQKHPIYITDTDHDYIIDEIKQRRGVFHERNINNSIFSNATTV